MRELTASDRNALIKLASSLPKGDETRKAILAGLKTGMENPEDARIFHKVEEGLEKVAIMVKSLEKEFQDVAEYASEEFFRDFKGIQNAIKICLRHVEEVHTRN